MGLILPADILEDISLALVDHVVETTLNPGGSTIPVGPQTVIPGSMRGIYVGCRLIVGSGANIEVVAVTGVTDTSFTASFVNAHGQNDPVEGATFPAGQTLNPLFFQSEILNYLAEVQDDFLLKTRILYTIGTVGVKVGTVIYATPIDCIRLERVSIEGLELYDVSETDLDLADAAWASDSSHANPAYWYQDKVGVQKFGVGPPARVGSTARLFYSRRSNGTTLDLLTPLLVPDVATHYLKYGVLARCFSKEGDQRDQQRTKYCQGRFDMGILIVAKFMRGLSARMADSEETVEPLLQSMGGG